MDKVLSKLKKQAKEHTGDSTPIEPGDDPIDGKLRKYEMGNANQKMKRSNTRKKQEIFQDAIGQIDEDDDHSHIFSEEDRPEFLKYIQPPGLETQLHDIYQWNIVDLIYE